MFDNLQEKLERSFKLLKGQGKITEINVAETLKEVRRAREQHIRREKASSNICSNEALCALTAAVYMAAMGPNGLQEVAGQCTAKAHYLAKRLCEIGGVRLVHPGPFFHEFVTTLPKTDKVLKALENESILGGLPVENGVLWCVTEKASREALDHTVAVVKEVLKA